MKNVARYLNVMIDTQGVDQESLLESSSRGVFRLDNPSGKKCILKSLRFGKDKMKLGVKQRKIRDFGD